MPNWWTQRGQLRGVDGPAPGQGPDRVAGHDAEQEEPGDHHGQHAHQGTGQAADDVAQGDDGPRRRPAAAAPEAGAPRRHPEARRQ